MNCLTGLDPAGPMFSANKPEERISNSSALFVDVIHTSGRLLGTTYQMGHADFFPNDGNWIQPGCWADIDGNYYLNISNIFELSFSSDCLMKCDYESEWIINKLKKILYWYWGNHKMKEVIF